MCSILKELEPELIYLYYELLLRHAENAVEPPVIQCDQRLLITQFRIKQMVIQRLRYHLLSEAA